MNNYTPTTTEVRAIYRVGRDEVPLRRGVGFPYEEFDRWLAAHEREAKAEAWDEAIHHVEPMLGPGFKRAAISDNPYRGGTP